MITAQMPRITTWRAWREAARGFLAAGHAPEDIHWRFDGSDDDLFAPLVTPAAPSLASAQKLTVPRAFLSTAELAICHASPERFAKAYRLLWRLQSERGLMAQRGDKDVQALADMAKNVSRCRHKMKAFVRFREVGSPSAPRRAFAAWFEPTHHTVELTAPFFARRFADMDWCILTPDVSARFENNRLSFEEGQDKPPLSEDDTEELWTTYFRNIFNPARIKIGAMTSEMPRKYWKNMPETRAIPAMLAEADARVRAMAEAAPKPAPAYAAPASAQLAQQASAWAEDCDSFTTALKACTRCPLHSMATQAVAGEGPIDAPLMIVGEQPGDQEDLAGKPFVGPAGRLLDGALDAAGIERSQSYLTNAVKHFRFKPHGKRRLHQRPDSSHIEHCRWWLDLEETRQDPQLIVAMGATALEALTGSGKNILKRRGTLEQTRLGHPVLVTLHPSYILRLPKAAQIEARAAFITDLNEARRLLSA